jgi:hypothetical protein
MRIESKYPVPSGGWIHGLNGDPLPEVVRPEKPVRSPINIATWTRRAVTFFKHPKADRARAYLAKELGVDSSQLRALRVGLGFDDKYRQWFWSFPHRNHEGEFVGITRRWCNPVVHDGIAKGKMAMAKSYPGLFYADWFQYAYGPIFVPEGASDVAALASISLGGVGRPSNTGGIMEVHKMLSEETQPIVVLGENDEDATRRGRPRMPCTTECQGCLNCFPGKYGAIKAAKELAKLRQGVVYWSMPPDGEKDVRSWRNNQQGDWFDFMQGVRRNQETNQGGYATAQGEVT